MSFSIGNNTSVNSVNTNSTVNNVNVTAAVPPAYKMASDSVTLSNVANTPQPLPLEASGWKKFSNSVGEVFSSIADAMKFGETYSLIRQEFNRTDYNRNRSLEFAEFN